MFGYPTGVGALIVRTSVVPLLKKVRPRGRKAGCWGNRIPVGGCGACWLSWALPCTTASAGGRGDSYGAAAAFWGRGVAHRPSAHVSARPLGKGLRTLPCMQKDGSTTLIPIAADRVRHPAGVLGRRHRGAGGGRGELPRAQVPPHGPPGGRNGERGTRAARDGRGLGPPRTKQCRCACTGIPAAACPEHVPSALRCTAPSLSPDPTRSPVRRSPSWTSSPSSTASTCSTSWAASTKSR